MNSVVCQDCISRVRAHGNEDDVMILSGVRGMVGMFTVELELLVGHVGCSEKMAKRCVEALHFGGRVA
jgi:hypothetical protein